jgi:hypothetical protein
VSEWTSLEENSLFVRELPTELTVTHIIITFVTAVLQISDLINTDHVVQTGIGNTASNTDNSISFTDLECQGNSHI